MAAEVRRGRLGDRRKKAGSVRIFLSKGCSIGIDGWGRLLYNGWSRSAEVRGTGEGASTEGKEVCWQGATSG